MFLSFETLIFPLSICGAFFFIIRSQQVFFFLVNLKCIQISYLI